MSMEFEWDPKKATENFKKHGVPFHEAATVFGDPSSIPYEDPTHSIGETRFILMGTSVQGRILMVSFTERKERLRIISAREATRRERRIYEEERFGV
ncbi:MAG TPA: BrnT family toxin [Thermoanaerobaculia bacterium]|nr:BrnT family toxin [Thermoanaerobaculia bacterium]